MTDKLQLKKQLSELRIRVSELKSSMYLIAHGRIDPEAARREAQRACRRDDELQRKNDV
jgi:hypothetical protein